MPYLTLPIRFQVLFTPALRVLFNILSLYWIRYRSQDIFNVGSFCLPHSCPISKGHYSGYLLIWFILHYRAITFYDTSFQKTSCNTYQTKCKSKHHMWTQLPVPIQFTLYRFQSLLLTVSQLISFPLGTKTLQFPKFAIMFQIDD